MNQVKHLFIARHVIATIYVVLHFASLKDNCPFSILIYSNLGDQSFLTGGGWGSGLCFSQGYGSLLLTPPQRRVFFSDPPNHGVRFSGPLLGNIHIYAYFGI